MDAEGRILQTIAKPYQATFYPFATDTQSFHIFDLESLKAKILHKTRNIDRYLFLQDFFLILYLKLDTNSSLIINNYNRLS